MNGAGRSYPMSDGKNR
jgi:hypothetical protein